MSRPAAALAQGVYAASSGNSALAAAWMAKRAGISATAVVPDDAPQAKLAYLRQLDARVVKMPMARWWEFVTSGRHDEYPGLYLDAVRDPAAFAGNGTVGVEILEELADVDAIFVPFGGGGLACGIARAARVLGRDVKVIACELETAHPFTSAMRAGGPVTGPAIQAS